MDPASTTAAAAAASLDVAAMLPQSPPRRGTGHRRAQSEILLGGALPDDLTFDADLGVVGEAGGDEYEEYDDEDEEEGAGGSGAGGSRMFEMFLENSGGLAEQAESSPHPHQQAPPARPRHQHSVSMDGSTSLGSAAVGMAGRSGVDAKKAISDAKLAELALVDPKRAKRILANRQSAARSKERKMRYIAELERKVQTLQTEATTLSAQLAMLQRETSCLTSENSDLKKRVQTMDQQVRLQDALNDRLRDEINQLKVATGQVNADIGKMGNFGLSSYGGNKQLKVATGQVNADIGKTGNFGLSSYGGNKQLKVATGQVNANIGKTGNFCLSSYGGNQQNYQHTQIQSLLAAQQLQQLQIRSRQQQHLCTAQQHQLLQEVLPFPGDLKMKGLATTSHSQNAGASDGHAVKSEP